MQTLSLIFIALVAAVLACRFWLSRRQIRQVNAHRDRVPEAFLERIPIEAHRKAADYTVARQKTGLAEMLWGAALVLAWTLGGGLELVDSLWRGSGLGMPAHGVAVMLSVLIISQLLDTPFSAWRTFVVEERFGFNRSTPGLFAADQAKQLLLLVVLVGPLAWGSLWLMQTTDHWWLWVGLLWSAFLMLMMVLGPRVIAPLFNRFEPLDDETLRERIEALLKRCGFETRGVFIMDASRRSAHGNAYFTGLGRNKRIVFFDTLLEGLSAGEVESVLAHELGHFKLHHVPRRLVLSIALSLAALYVLALLSQSPAFFQTLGVTSPAPHMALLLFLLAGPYVGFFLTPLGAWLSRRDEYQADDFAREYAAADDLASALVKLTEDNAQTLTPDPVHSSFYDSHPPVAHRVRRLEASLDPGSA
jgi:STE24 endopeptidase